MTLKEAKYDANVSGEYAFFLSLSFFISQSSYYFPTPQYLLDYGLPRSSFLQN